MFLFDFDYFILNVNIYRVSHKKGISKNMAITPLKSSRNGISYMTGTKPFKISGEMGKRNELEVANPPLKLGKNSVH